MSEALFSTNSSARMNFTRAASGRRTPALEAPDPTTPGYPPWRRGMMAAIQWGPWSGVVRGGPAGLPAKHAALPTSDLDTLQKVTSDSSHSWTLSFFRVCDLGVMPLFETGGAFFKSCLFISGGLVGGPLCVLARRAVSLFVVSFRRSRLAHVFFLCSAP